MNTLLQAHRVEKTLTEDGTLTLDHLPFQAGESVEVIVLPHARPEAGSEKPYSLRGLPVQYVGPTEPVAEQDWDALQ